MEIQEKYRKDADEFVRRALKNYSVQIESIILFGSVARGDAREDSDIDILIIWRGDEAEGWRIMTGLAFDVLLDTGDYISVKVLLPQDLKIKTPFINNVKREGVKIV
jgi:predicted nucleotidyltransferase